MTDNLLLLCEKDMWGYYFIQTSTEFSSKILLRALANQLIDYIKKIQKLKSSSFVYLLFMIDINCTTDRTDQFLMVRVPCGEAVIARVDVGYFLFRHTLHPSKSVMYSKPNSNRFVKSSIDETHFTM